MSDYAVAILVLLASLAVGLALVGWQVWRLNKNLEPLLGSSIMQGLTSL